MRVLGIFLATFVSAAPSEEKFPVKGFQKLHAMIKPCAGEAPWRSVGWRTSLWEARQEAAKKGLPLFVWGLNNGHPEGKT